MNKSLIKVTQVCAGAAPHCSALPEDVLVPSPVLWLKSSCCSTEPSSTKALVSRDPHIRALGGPAASALRQTI